jgi:transcriptional regulator with XRE-family HTH domain
MAQSSTSFDLSPKHVRAARALLAWSQQDLAKHANVATSTIADFERGYRTPVANNAQAIRAALEGAGVHFLPTGAVIGPPIPPMASATRPGIPVRWVNADDLSEWANRTEGAFDLPTLIGYLIRATLGTGVQLHFPADGGVRQPGWDGRSSTAATSEYVPFGDAGWEISVQRDNIAQKATTDYRKRTRKPFPLDPADATYVFVTLRHWAKKAEWVAARMGEGVWKDVRAYDVNDLVHWIEQTPAVGRWLANRIGKRSEGVLELDQVWEEWSLATKWPLTEELVLSDRDQDAAEVLRWLREKPSILSLQGTTTEEVIAFFHAALSELPNEAAASYRTRSLVVTTTDSARALAPAPAPLILLLTDPEAGLARSLVERGHYVLQAYDDRPVSRGEVRRLQRPSREGISTALMAAGIAEPRARALARDSARNLAVLRRLIPHGPGRVPDWAQEAPPPALLAALLAGGWSEDYEADKARLAQLADQPYDKVISVLTSYVGDLDQPLRRIGSTWRVASPPDAWFLLAPYLTSEIIDRFEAAALAVLGSADPRFEMDPDERWMASIKGVHPAYSGLMRHGIGEVLILLALWGQRAQAVRDTGRRVDSIVHKLLYHGDPHRWWSLSRDFRLLAEASPHIFLDSIQDSLDQEQPPIRALFGTEEGVFGTEHLSDLLWALESLAWSPDLMPRVSHVLARLDAIDNPPGRYANRPGRSLREIHLLWDPQTFASLEQRLRALDLVRKHESNAAWKLMLGILPGSHDTSMDSPLPLWRDFTVDDVEVVTYGLIGRGAVAVTERLLADVDLNAGRWEKLLDRFPDLKPDIDTGLVALDRAESQITEKADRAVLWKKLRHVLHHHRQFPEAEWSMPAQVLDRLESIYHRFAPDDPYERIAWLFERSVALPNSSKDGWQARERDIDGARISAAKDLYKEQGAEGVLALARLTDAAGFIGKALYDSGLSPQDLEDLIEASVQSDNPRERDVAHGLIVAAFHDLKAPWGAELVAKARTRDWGETALMTVLRALPVRRWTWDRVAEAGPDVESEYWRRISVFWMTDDEKNAEFAIRKLITAGRARNALALAEHADKAKLSSDLLIELLEAAAQQPHEDNADGNEAVMFQHYVSEILQRLDERNDVNEDTLIRLEWVYLAVLEHSRRPAKVLLKALSEQPALFVDMLRAVYKPDAETVLSDAEPDNVERARSLARQAHRLLELWNRLPGTRVDGNVDVAILESWIKEARSLAHAAGREKIADSRIGAMLSASPTGTDGNWPTEAVRHVIDLFKSKPMIDGFWVGKRNRRGMTSRSPRDGGALERQEAAKYRRWAKSINIEHPYTARALDSLADSYEEEAARHDESSERRDWEY